MPKFDKKKLRGLSKLCRIECSDEEVDALQKNLQSILDHIDHLSEVDTEGVEPCNHVSSHQENALRADEVDETLPRETFLDNSPSHVGGMVRVPTVIKF